MNQKQIEIVLSVAKNLSFSEAAYETCYAASVVSKQVAALEDELGVRIFDRKARSRVALTEIGERMLPHLTRIQKEYGQIREMIAPHSASGTLRMTCPRGFSGLGEDELISIFCAQNPNIEIQQREGGVSDCQALLTSGEADLSVRMFTAEQLEEARSASQSLMFTRLSQNCVGIILKEDHPAIRDGQVDLAALRDETFFFRAFEENTKADAKIDCFRKACRSEGFEPNLYFSRDIRSRAAYAMAAQGLCVIPSMHAPTALYPGICYMPFSKSYYSFTIGLLYRRDNTSPALKKFVKCAVENAHIFSNRVSPPPAE